MSFAGPSFLYNIQYYGQHIFTTVTATASVVDEWIGTTLHKNRRNLYKLLVGVDTEWCMPTDPNGYQKVAIVQICVGKRCLIFQLIHADKIPKSLIDFFGNDKFTFIGKEVANDTHKLFEDYGLQVARTEDVGYWASMKFNDRYIQGMGLKALVSKFLSKSIPKPKKITLSKWDVKKLRYEQVEYACHDAYVSFELGVFFSKTA